MKPDALRAYTNRSRLVTGDVDGVDGQSSLSRLVTSSDQPDGPRGLAPRHTATPPRRYTIEPDLTRWGELRDPALEAEFLEHMRAAASDVLTEIRTTQKLSDDTQTRLEGIVADFKRGFATTDGSSVVPDAHVAAMDEADVEKEAVHVRKPAPKKK